MFFAGIVDFQSAGKIKEKGPSPDKEPSFVVVCFFENPNRAFDAPPSWHQRKLLIQATGPVSAPIPKID